MSKPLIDLREHSRQTKRHLILGGLGLVLLVGVGLIALTYGTPAAVCGLTALLVALVPVALILLILAVLQWLADRADKDA